MALPCCHVFQGRTLTSPGRGEPILGRVCSSFKIVGSVDFHTLLQYSLKMFFLAFLNKDI
jgi:hypothetical protein